MTLGLIVIVSLALVVGAVWGVLRPPSERTEGVLLAGAGGALMVAVLIELIGPNAPLVPLWSAMLAVAIGGACFVVLDQWIERTFSSSHGFGLWLAITLDGIPENLALGVLLITATPMEAAALGVSILMANIPEAAGGAREMRADGRSARGVITIWALTAVVLAASAVIGNLALSDVAPRNLALVNCFAAGAVTASLAVEIFPRAFRESSALTGYGVTLGLILAYVVGALGA